MESQRKYPFRIYFWMVPNPFTGRMRKTRYRMTELEAARFPGAVRVDADALEITGPGQHTSAFQPPR
jgi:hypothetical protein